MKITLIKLLAVVLALLGIVGLILDVIIAIESSICIYHGHTLEKCKYNSLPQCLGTILSAIEAFKSLFLISALFLWRRFSTKNFLLALGKVGHFWVWFMLCTLSVVTVAVVKSVESRDKQGHLSPLGIFLMLEFVSMTLFASAVNFVSRETYEHWVQQQTGSGRWERFFRLLYFLILVSYLVRNFGSFLYDTALVSLSISLVTGRSIKQHHWDGFLLLVMATFRGSFVKYFFAKIFQGQDLPTVCDNVPKQTASLSYIDVRQQRKTGGDYRILDAVTSPELSLDIQQT